MGTIGEKAIVAIRPMPAFYRLFEIATTWKGSDVVLNKQGAPKLDMSLGRLIRVSVGDRGESNVDSLRTPLVLRLPGRYHASGGLFNVQPESVGLIPDLPLSGDAYVV